MNPEQNRGGTTVQALMVSDFFISAAVPVIAIAALVMISLQVKSATYVFIALAIAIIVLIISLVTHYFVQRKMKEHFNNLIDVCQDYVGGDRGARAVVNGDDDFAKLTLALNTLLDNQGSSANPVMGSAGGSDAAALQAQIEKLLQEVSAVGDGDLRVQAEVTPDTLGVLADSFNYMIEELAKVVGRVQSTAVQVTNATRRILDRSAELAQASEVQVKQIGQTTESVEALAIFIQNVARNAQMSVESAQDALRFAATGQQAVRQTIDGMMLIRENVQETSKKIKRLGERSNEIGEIVRIIEDIADQTNLLALNAAIQSAMAGEHGRGFAVVADEIRLLAERSTESTKRIATLVKSIQGDTYEAVVAMEDSTQEVVKGSQLADDAGRSLNSIYGAVERQAQMIESIARSANDQTTVSEAVAVTMGHISEITRQTDAGTQEAAVSVSYLAELSEQLRASVSTFRLPDRTSEMLGSFGNMTSVTEVSDGRSGQLFPATIGSSAGSDNSNWGGQSFAGGFPPLPEPGNTGSLVPMAAARPGNFNNGQPNQFGGQGDFAGQQFYGSEPDFAGNNGGFEMQPGFNGNFGGSPFGSNPGFGGQGQFAPANPAFGGQGQFPPLNPPSNPGFGGQGQFPPLNPPSNPGFGGQGQYPPLNPPSNPGFGGQGQYPPANPGAGAPGRQRWQSGPQQDQNQ